MKTKPKAKPNKMSKPKKKNALDGGVLPRPDKPRV